MEVISSISELRSKLDPIWRVRKTIGIVPTMGALHAGHMRLIEEARKYSDCVVVSIFVNPIQFDRKEDFERYPQTLDQDSRLCEAAGVDFIFSPNAAELYPQEQLAFVDVPALTEFLCGEFRPGHFRGVATVVAKLFNIVQPHQAYFGEKDAQQLAVIRRMVSDLNMPLTIVPVATVRESDGLALSSRNKHLNEEQRKTAPLLYQALSKAAEVLQSGERSSEKVQKQIEPMFQGSQEIRLEYFEIVDPETMRPVKDITSSVLIAGAMWVGATRLIDNLLWKETAAN